MFDIDIKTSGFKETIDMLDKMVDGLTEQGLNEYCNKVKNEASKICGLTDMELTLRAKKVGKDITIDFKMKDRSKLDCFKQAIKNILPLMPVTTKALFEQLIIQIEKKYPKTDAS